MKILNFLKKDTYQILLPSEVVKLKKKYATVWKNSSIPEKQLRRTAQQIDHLDKIPAIANLIVFVKETKMRAPTILEVGCSTGYHAIAFEKAKVKVHYEGCDYSKAFITKAKELHPKLNFKVCDATRLTYKTKSFDILLSGGCILHVANYQRAICESSRVAKKYVIFHRTPVIHMRETTYTKKIGYGLEMMEIVFNEQELIEEFRKNKLAVIAVNSHDQFTIAGINEPVYMKNYLCLKI